MPTFDHDGIHFNYEVIGSGRPIVFCHGLGGDLNQAKQLIGELPGGLLIFWDARAHGLTEPLGPVEKLNFQTFSHDLSALMEYLGIDQAIVGGISMGSGVGIRLAIDRPKFVSALVLIRPAWLDQPYPPNLTPMVEIGRLLGLLPADEACRQFALGNSLSEVRRVSNYAADSLVQQFHKPRAFERRERLLFVPASAPIRGWNEVSTIHQPALVITTRCDPVHPFEIAQQWAGHLPQACLFEVTAQDKNLDLYRLQVRKHVISFLVKLRASGA